MSTLTTPTSAFAQACAAFTAAAARFGRRVVTAWRHSGDLAVLASFDERMLRDIGLTRGDLDDALAAPLWRDPTAVLVRRQHERHAVRVTSAVIDLLPGCAAPSIVPRRDAPAAARPDPRWRLAS